MTTRRSPTEILREAGIDESAAPAALRALNAAGWQVVPKVSTRQTVSDHAVLRFLERVYGVDVEAVRAAIAEATARGREAAALAGDSSFAIVIERIRFVIMAGRVVTTLGHGRFFRPRLSRRR